MLGYRFGFAVLIAAAACTEAEVAEDDDDGDGQASTSGSTTGAATAPGPQTTSSTASDGSTGTTTADGDSSSASTATSSADETATTASEHTDSDTGVDPFELCVTMCGVEATCGGDAELCSAQCQVDLHGAGLMGCQAAVAELYTCAGTMSCEQWPGVVSLSTEAIGEPCSAQSQAFIAACGDVAPASCISACSVVGACYGPTFDVDACEASCTMTSGRGWFLAEMGCYDAIDVANACVAELECDDIMSGGGCVSERAAMDAACASTQRVPALPHSERSVAADDAPSDDLLGIDHGYEERVPKR
jgi:hypothetical protein